MTRNASFVVGFLVTTCVLVPAGWHQLGADIETDGKHLRPLVQSFTIDGTRVTLEVDRNLVMTGDRVTAKLVAFSDTPHQVPLDLTVLQSNNYAGERVEIPAVAIDREKLVLEAAPGGGPPVVTWLRLGKRPARAAMTDSFRVYVAPRGEKPPTSEGEGRPDWDANVEKGRAAAVGVLGWSGNNLGIAIQPQGPVTGDAPFLVTVTVKNTSGAALANAPSIELGTQLGLQGGLESSDDVVVERIDDSTDEPAGDAAPDHAPAWKRGAQHVARFRVTPNKQGLHEITFVAQAFAWDDEPGPIIGGAMDAKTFAVVDRAAPAVVGAGEAAAPAAIAVK